MKQILFYDGDCGLCNHAVQRVLKYEKNDLLYFSALQSDFSKAFFDKKMVKSPDLSSVVFYDNGTFFYKSNAALKIAKHLKFPWGLLPIFWFVPRFIRDYVYDIIAKNRHRMVKSYCVVLNPKQKERFLN